MSLKVWLPLDGDLHNQGCSNIEIIDKNSTVNTNGKIGSCYYFSAASYCVSFPWIFNASDSCSATCWFKLNSVTSSTQWIFNCNAGGGNANTHLGIYITTSGILYTVGTVNATYTTTIQANTWYHIALCLDTINNKTYLYLNGEQLVNASYSGSGYTTTYCTVGARRNGSGYNYGMIGYANDFRLYNHCLSAAEVKEIAQGLVLHYKFDRSGISNFVTSNGTKTVTLRADATNAYTGYWYLDTYVKANNLLPANRKYIVEYDYNATVLTSTSAYLYSQINTARCAPNSAMTAIRTSTTGHVVEHFSMTSAQATYSSSFRFRLRFYGAGGDSVTISNLAIYIDTGEDIHTIQDSSGYGYSAISATNNSYIINTPKYCNALSISNATYATINSNIFTMDTLSSEFTISCWIKRTYADSTARYIYSGIVQLYLRSDYGAAISWNHATTSSSANNAWATSNIIAADTWTHLVFTFKDGIMKYYKNGAYVKQSDQVSTGQYIKGYKSNYLFANSSQDAGFIGAVSDLRIYTTALSADDILELYHTSAKVDNLHELHGFEFVENASSIKINKQGQMKAGEFQENTATKLYEINQIVETNNLIEL